LDSFGNDLPGGVAHGTRVTSPSSDGSKSRFQVIQLAAIKCLDGISSWSPKV
jgi:hypothetical protein